MLVSLFLFFVALRCPATTATPGVRCHVAFRRWRRRVAGLWFASRYWSRRGSASSAALLLAAPTHRQSGSEAWRRGFSFLPCTFPRYLIERWFPRETWLAVTSHCWRSYSNAPLRRRLIFNLLRLLPPSAKITSFSTAFFYFSCTLHVGSECATLLGIACFHHLCTKHVLLKITSLFEGPGTTHAFPFRLQAFM